MSAVSGGVYLSGIGPSKACGGKLTVWRWRLNVNAPEVVAVLGTALAAAHVRSEMRLRHPGASVSGLLAKKETTVRTGDFGEFLAYLLFSQRLGREAPYCKLTTKPVAGATQQGSDHLALTIVPRSEPEAVVVEVKVRDSISPKADLGEITKSLGRVTEDYLTSAWTAAVRLVESHPDHRRAYALAGAIGLARLDSPDEPRPDHDRQAVIVSSAQTLTVGKINEIWGSHPPVSELHLIEVPGLNDFIDLVYDHAGTLTYADVDQGVPEFLAGRDLQPGVEALVSSAEAKAVARAGWTKPILGVIEAALWALAGWDGMASARARQLAEATTDPVAGGLAHLLIGQSGRAGSALGRDHELGVLVSAAERLWNRAISVEDFDAEVATLRAGLEDEVADAVGFVASAITYRYPRLPSLLTEAAGATGPNVKAVVRTANARAWRALWPSQARALDAGLLDRGQPSVAMKMPTSAGKTFLIALVAADALDAEPTKVVAVVAPTRALVRQLTSDLRKTLPDAVAVRSSHGGLDFDTEDLSGPGLFGEPGIVVLTPERLDLEWRRQGAGEAEVSVTNRLALLVADEAHMLSETRRGGRLELVIARALRARVRVVMASSQFPNPGALAKWLDGLAIESDWSPTWLHRRVYYRSADKIQGLLLDEADNVVPALTLVTPSKARADACVRDRVSEAAALAELVRGEGLVVVYAEQRARMDKLSEAVRTRFADLPPVEDPRLGAAIAPLEKAYPDHWAALRVGVGIHHARVPVPVRQVVERCAARGLLRAVVCTSTLLEGVNFPTKTVICAYPPQDKYGKPLVAKLANLAGRAGRGGMFSSGELIVLVKEEADAKKWLRAFRAELPPTVSALQAALEYLRRERDYLDEADPDTLLATIDALIMEALAEGATMDGDLRHALEALLGRTLWYSGAHPTVREHVLARAVERAEIVRRTVASELWKAAFYRTGLPLRSCRALREAIIPDVDALAAELANPATNFDDLLIWLTCQIAPHAAELAGWRSIDPDEVVAVLRVWVAGAPLEEIVADHAEAWEAINGDLESLVPWILTAVVEFILAGAALLAVRDTVHARLGISRLRYGVPHTQLCDLVRRGADRVRMAQLAAEYEALGLYETLTTDLAEFVVKRLQEDQDSGESDDEPF